jgi:hypothetical protein
MLAQEVLHARHSIQVGLTDNSMSQKLLVYTPRHITHAQRCAGCLCITIQQASESLQQNVCHVTGLRASTPDIAVVPVRCNHVQ